jgi:hypothetical protein
MRNSAGIRLIKFRLPLITWGSLRYVYFLEISRILGI